MESVEIWRKIQAFKLWKRESVGFNFGLVLQFSHIFEGKLEQSSWCDLLRRARIVRVGEDRVVVCECYDLWFTGRVVVKSELEGIFLCGKTCS